MASVREYAIRFIRGGKSSSGSLVVGGGDILLDTPQHELDGLEHTRRDTYIKAMLGGEEGVVPLGTLGATATIGLTLGNYVYGTLDADCTFTFPSVRTGYGNGFVLELTEDGTGGWQPTWPGSVAWPSGTPPTHDDTAGTTTIYLFESRDGGTTWYGFQAGSGGGASTSPLTTKGDLWGYDTADARVPVGTDAYLLAADSTDAQGVSWKDPQMTGHYELLMAGGISSPPEPLENGDGTDWLYVWVP